MKGEDQAFAGIKPDQSSRLERLEKKEPADQAKFRETKDSGLDRVGWYYPVSSHPEAGSGASLLV
jgi:hypothetical protein